MFLCKFSAKINTFKSLTNRLKEIEKRLLYSLQKKVTDLATRYRCSFPWTSKSVDNTRALFSLHIWLLTTFQNLGHAPHFLKIYSFHKPAETPLGEWAKWWPWPGKERLGFLPPGWPHTPTGASKMRPSSNAKKGNTKWSFGRRANDGSNYTLRDERIAKAVSLLKNIHCSH